MWCGAAVSFLTGVQALDAGCVLLMADLDSDGGERLCVLSAQERDRLARIVDPVQRRRRAASRVALRRALAEALGVPPSDVPLRVAPDGAVRLAGTRDLWFSVSHAGAIGVIAVSRVGVVGVDVEMPRPAEVVVPIARRWFSTAEAQALEAMTGADAGDAFLRCWTAKEAAVKAVGVGLAHYIGRVVVEPDLSRAVSVVDAPAGVGIEMLEMVELSLASSGARVTVALSHGGSVCGCRTLCL